MGLKDAAKKTSGAVGSVDRERALQAATEVATLVANRSSNRKVVLVASVLAKGLSVLGDPQVSPSKPE
jgi:hypothetical protein